MIENIAWLLVSDIIGWLIFYFIRCYKKFLLSMLVVTNVTILGCDGIF